MTMDKRDFMLFKYIEYSSYAVLKYNNVVIGRLIKCANVTNTLAFESVELT